MEGSGVMQHKGTLKVDVAGGYQAEVAFAEMRGSGSLTTGSNGGWLARQSSMGKNSSCLCSPTTHAGSFRCRLHRASPSLQRTKSIDSTAAAVQDSQSKPTY